MTARRRLAVVSLAAALAACGKTATTTPSLLLNEPSAVAAFRGHTSKHGALWPYLAIANSGSNDLTIVDGRDDSLVPAPVPLRALVYPVPNRPALLASAALGDGGSDLLVAVAAGDSKLQVVVTWDPSGGVTAPEVELGGDVLALVALPSAPNTARIAAALSGARIAVATFGRVGATDAIDAAAAAATVQLSPTLTFQPLALAAMPGDPTRVWAATLDDLGGGVHGVAGIDVSGASPSFAVDPLDAGAPTRLVAAARLAERLPGTAVAYEQAPLDPSALVSAFAGQPVVGRVYAILDESGCGPAATIACGLVALDPVTHVLATDLAGELPHRAPIAVPGRAVALAAAEPPEEHPSTTDPIYAGTYMRIGTALGNRATTAAAAIASTDGSLYFVDLGRWEIPSEQVVHQAVRATATAARAPPVAGAPPVDQWLVLEPSGGGTVAHSDPAGLTSAVTVTPGYTPTDRWTITHEGKLPGLSLRRAETGDAGGGQAWLALQAGAAPFSEVVHLYDPTVGVHAGDLVVVEPSTIAGCTASFEATVDLLLPPDAARYPGGAVRLASVPAGCVAPLTAGAAGLRATFRAGGSKAYVLVRGTGDAAVQVGRPSLGTPFSVAWTDETGFGSCLLPPAVPWPETGPVPSCDEGSACRIDCEGLRVARQARRLSYVPESCTGEPSCRFPGLPDVTGPALELTLALERLAVPAPRDLALVVDTVDGRSPFRATDVGTSPTEPRAIATFDRSPDVAAEGVRFLVPYSGGAVLDATPTIHGGNVRTLH